MTKPFDHNDLAAIYAALESPDPEDPIAQLIAANADMLGRDPSELPAPEIRIFDHGRQ